MFLLILFRTVLIVGGLDVDFGEWIGIEVSTVSSGLSAEWFLEAHVDENSVDQCLWERSGALENGIVDFLF